MRVIVRGGGDLASGVIIRMRRAGWQVLVTELAQPKAVRRTVSFAQAVYSGEAQVEEIAARRVHTLTEADDALANGFVPVLVDPALTLGRAFRPHVLVDARMRKKTSGLGKDAALLVIGLGPGFTAGEDCHAVVETNRGPFLGRVYWQGSAQPDTGIPEGVGKYVGERVLRAPQLGVLEPAAEIGQMLKRGDLVARVGEAVIVAPFQGVLRGLIQQGLTVERGEKVGDIDPRSDARLCWIVSDKALAIGGGALEAVLTWMAGRDQSNESSPGTAA